MKPVKVAAYENGYTGGKESAGTYQKIINEIRPFDLLIVPFLGHCAITRNIDLKGAKVIGIDINPNVINAWYKEGFNFIELHQGNGWDITSPDVVTSGTGQTGITTDLLINTSSNGNISFQVDTAHDFVGLSSSANEFVDIDNDGDLDLVYGGDIWAGADPNDYKTYVYKNDGNGNFTLFDTLPGKVKARMAFAAVDNDGDLDLYYNGDELRDNPVFDGFFTGGTDLYLNDGTGKFTICSCPSLDSNVGNGDNVAMDVNGDGRLDIVDMGWAWGPMKAFFISKKNGHKINFNI